MTREESIEKLCCLVLDIPKWYKSTDDYALDKLGKTVEECSDDEIIDLLMDVQCLISKPKS